MDPEDYHLGEIAGNPQRNIRSNRFKAEERYIEICQGTGRDILDRIRIGDRVRSACGKQGVVADIEILTRYIEKQYYFRLEKGAGTILVIK